MSMKTPKTRIEFESHINLVVEDAERIIKTTYSIRILNAFQKAKYLPNRRSNFLTIDEQFRLMANMQATVRMMRDSRFYSPKENNND